MRSSLRKRFYGSFLIKVPDIFRKFAEYFLAFLEKNQRSLKKK
jgi:hypothetical protein